jgi:hypothetical protein
VILSKNIVSTALNNVWVNFAIRLKPIKNAMVPKSNYGWLPLQQQHQQQLIKEANHSMCC